MTIEQYNKHITELIHNEIENAKPKMSMQDFLNKHAQGNDTILGYWFGNDLNGLTDIEILQKCVWLDLTKCNILVTLFGFDKFEEFTDDYIAVINKLGYELKSGAVWKK